MGLKLHQERFTLDVRRHFFSKSTAAVAQLPRDVVGSLEVLKERGRVVLRDMG